MSEYCANAALESAAQERARIAAVLAPTARATRRPARRGFIARLLGL